MSKVTNPSEDLWDEIPYTFTRRILIAIGAIPCSLNKPHLPTTNLRNSTLLYCIAMYGLTLALGYMVIASMIQHMAEAYPYDHLNYILAFEIIVWTLPMCFTLVSWIETKELKATIVSWHNFMTKYEAVMRKKMPNHYTRERVFTLVILATPICSWATVYLTKFTLVDWKQPIAGFFACGTQLTIVLHWNGYNRTIALVATDLSAYLKERVREQTVTSKLVEDYKTLYLLLRDITENMSKMRTPLYSAACQYITSTIMVYETVQFYLRTGDAMVVTLNILGLGLFALPLSLTCSAGHYATEKVNNLFDDVFSSCELSCLSERSQREVALTYFMKSSKKSSLTLFGFAEVNHALLSSAFSELFMYVLIMAQFHHMGKSVA